VKRFGDNRVMSTPMARSVPAVPQARRRFAARTAIPLALVAAALVAATMAIPMLRHGALRVLGASLLVSDPIEPGDVVVISESGGNEEFQAAELEVSELYGRRLFTQVLLLRPSPDVIDDELARRGVRLENPGVATLRQLGVPEAAIVVLDTGEGGTTDSTQMLAQWARAHPSRVLVVIGATHARRYRRALLRVWPENAPPPRVMYPHRTAFKPESWWTLRRTLRDGVFELQKLAWDYVRHPW
jgi:uncharacterized SAM-binding protein YcdF (DUF218 family)